jgi:hypothetical protein
MCSGCVSLSKELSKTWLSSKVLKPAPGEIIDATKSLKSNDGMKPFGLFSLPMSEIGVPFIQVSNITQTRV